MKKNYTFTLLFLALNLATAQVSLVNNISTNAKAEELTSTSLGLLFKADDNPTILNLEPFISDGTTSGTQKLKEINTNNVVTNAASVLSPNKYVELNGNVYFVAGDASNNYELWKTDGTESGTTLVKEINASTASSGQINYITVFNGKLYFSARNSSALNGFELWTSDGTQSGTIMLKDINPGNANSSPSEFTVFNNNLYFTADDGANGRELWMTDGTNAGTILVKDLVTGATGSNPQFITAYNNALYFRANGELYKSNGAVGNGGALRPLNNNPIINPAGFNVFGNRLFFSGDTASAGRELWSTNGVPFGTSLFKDINSGTEDSNPQDFEISNSILFFKAIDTSGNFELWKSDGTAANTIAVSNSNLNPSKLIDYNNQVYFFGTNSRLWVSDGTIAGTQEISGSYPNIVSQKNMAVHNNELFFSSGNLYKYLDPTLSNNEYDGIQKINLYPNPTNDYITIKTNQIIKKVNIVDISGKLVKSFDGNITTYDISHLESGMYFAKLLSNNTKQTLKFIKQ